MEQPLVIITNNEVAINTEFLEQYKAFKKLKLEMELKEKEFKEKLKVALEQCGKKDLLLDGFSATIKKGSTRTTIDSKRLKEELPDIYEEYSKTTEVGSSIVITIE